MPEIPEPWASAMVAKGFTDRRTKVPRPSARALADAAGVHATTVLAMIGGAASDPRSIHVVARALGRDPETVSGWIDPTRLVSDPWVPPDEAHLLDRRQRDALTELIRSMAAGQRSGERSGQQHPTPKSQAGGSPADDASNRALRSLPGYVDLSRPAGQPDVSVEDYTLAARDDDDDAESEAQQQEP